MKKIFVDMLVQYTKEGEQIPVSLTWEDGRKFDIDRVFEHQRSASLKVGGQGIRYRCRIMGKDVYLFLEEGTWFMEGK